MPTMKRTKTWKAVSNATIEITDGTIRLLGVVKLKLHKAKNRVTPIKEIHITPEDDDNRWASRSSSGTVRAPNISSSHEDMNIPVVHDIKDEYDPEYR